MIAINMKTHLLIYTFLFLSAACSRDEWEPEVTDWQTEQHATEGVNAVYAALQKEGAYGKWLYFAYDMRSDEGMTNKEEMTRFCNFTLGTDCEINRTIWHHHYQGIFRANQVLKNVPHIAMQEDLKKRLLAEARFLRALFYFNLVSLYGNVPLVLEPLPADALPEMANAQQVSNQIIADLKIAKEGLPLLHTPENAGRATRGAAAALLGKTYLQMHRWAEGEKELREVIESGIYDLMPSYKDNFTQTHENNRESVFEVQFGRSFTDETGKVTGQTAGNAWAWMLGPRGICRADGQPTRWLFEEFQKERNKKGLTDERLLTTMFCDEPGVVVYGRPYREFYGSQYNELFWRKYTNSDGQNYEAESSGINIRVMRFAEVLLLYAEALNETGNTAAAYGFINRVRARASMRPLEQVAPGLSQQQMRGQIAHERVVELAGEGVRFNDLKRWRLLCNQLQSNDIEFAYFQQGKSELLPLPEAELKANPNLRQNPGW